MKILVDHNIEGQSVLLWGVLAAEGWLELVPLQRLTFHEVGLPFDSSDRVVWRFAQAQQMVLLTGNRSMKGDDSLEQTLREENTPNALPVITIAGMTRLDERGYRERCSMRLLEIMLDIDQYRGTRRIFIP
jgi:predicted nuclease of predicted toxin-antitoxin system